MSVAPIPKGSGTKPEDQAELRRSRKQFLFVLIGMLILFGICVWLASLAGTSTETEFWHVPYMM